MLGATDITWNTVLRTSPDFTHTTNSSEITCNFSGDILMTFAVGINGVTDRVQLSTHVFINNAKDPFSKSVNYVARNSDQNEGGINTTYLVNVTAGDVLKIQASVVVDGGGAFVDPNQTRLLITKL